VVTLRLEGQVPPELWNRLGTKLIPKLKSGEALSLTVGASVTVPGDRATTLLKEVRQILADLGLQEAVKAVTEG
jgi:hypothetical protein